MTEVSEKIEGKCLFKESLITSLVMCLEEIASQNKRKNNTIQYEEFICKRPPSVPIDEYLNRILKYTRLEKSTLILSLIYLDRICEFNGIKIDMYSIHKLIVISILIAVKYNEDDIHTNSFFSKVVGISQPDLNKLEVFYLNLLNYDLYVKSSEYLQYENYLKDQL